MTDKKGDNDVTIMQKVLRRLEGKDSAGNELYTELLACGHLGRSIHLAKGANVPTAQVERKCLDCGDRAKRIARRC